MSHTIYQFVKVCAHKCTSYNYKSRGEKIIQLAIVELLKLFTANLTTEWKYSSLPGHKSLLLQLLCRSFAAGEGHRIVSGRQISSFSNSMDPCLPEVLEGLAVGVNGSRSSILVNK